MADWQTKTLGEVLLKTETVNPALAPDEEFDYIDVSSVSNATYAVEATQRLKGREAPSRARRLVCAGDVILATIRPTLKRIAVVPPELDGQVCSTGYFVLRPYSDIDHRFLFYYLFTEQFLGAMESLQKGASYPAVTDAEVRTQPISFPRIQEQRRIVAILDEAFEGIATAKANAEKNLQNARELYRNHVKSVFMRAAEDWPTRTLDQISMNLDSRRVPVTKSDRKAGEFPYYGASGIVDYVADYIFEGEALLVSEDGANLLARSTPIAFPASGRYWVNNHAHILKFDQMATQQFVEFFLESIPLDVYITGAAQPKLNQRALNSIPIPIPDSVNAQVVVVDLLERVAEQTERLRTTYERKLAALGELKRSLLHQAFSGRLS